MPLDYPDQPMYVGQDHVGWSRPKRPDQATCVPLEQRVLRGRMLSAVSCPYQTPQLCDAVSAVDRGSLWLLTVMLVIV